MAKCNICGKKWWFSSRVKCDCRSREMRSSSVATPRFENQLVHNQTQQLLLHSALSEQDTKQNCMNESLISESQNTATSELQKIHCEPSYTPSVSSSGNDYSGGYSSSSSDSGSSSSDDSSSW